MSAFQIITTFFGLFLGLLGGILLGGMFAGATDEEAIGRKYLGSADCLEFKILLPGPAGVMKVGEQFLCGYHLEWSPVIGGDAKPHEFAPDPKSNL